MQPRNNAEKALLMALDMQDLRSGEKQTFVRDDGTPMVCIPREKFLDLIEGVGAEGEDYTDG